MKTPKNVGASVRQRLLNYTRATGEDHTMVLTRYAIERLLYRLSCSPQRDQFVLKGASLYVVWQSESESLNYRPTRDLDFWSSGAPDVETVTGLLREVGSMAVEDDGITYDETTIKAEARRVDEKYPGCSAELFAVLDGVRIRVLIDFGFGDAITPAAQSVRYPTILENSPAPNLRVYPRETVVAEKFEAMVSLDMTNSRLKDFYDIWTLSRTFDFDGQLLSEAMRQTFRRRQTALPAQIPTALTEQFSGDATKIAQWKQFGKRIQMDDLPPLPAIADELQGFLWPVAQGASAGDFIKQWQPRRGWSLD